MKKIIKFSIIIIFLYFLFYIWYKTHYSIVNIINENCNLDLPKPKSTETIIPGMWQDDTDFVILQYQEQNIEVIKKQINNSSIEELKQILFIIYQKASAKEEEIERNYFDFIKTDKEYLRFAYFNENRIKTLVIFNEKSMKLYYLHGLLWSENEIYFRTNYTYDTSEI